VSERGARSRSTAAPVSRRGVAKVAPGAGADEAPQLTLGRLAAPRDLLLEGGEGPQVALAVEHCERLFDTDRADELGLQVGDAHEYGHLEPGGFDPPANQQGLLTGVAQRDQPKRRRRVLGEHSADGAGTADRDDRDPLDREVAPLACPEGVR